MSKTLSDREDRFYRRELRSEWIHYMASRDRKGVGRESLRVWEKRTGEKGGRTK